MRNALQSTTHDAPGTPVAILDVVYGSGQVPPVGGGDAVIHQKNATITVAMISDAYGNR
jgi:hypothetical protein